MMPTRITIAQLAEHIGSEFKGDGNCEIHSIAPLNIAQAGQATFLDNPKYRKYLNQTKAAVVILADKYLADCPTNAIIAKNPHLAYAKLATLFISKPKYAAGVHASAVVAPSAQIAANASIGANCVIGNDVKIAEHVVVGAGTVIGDTCEIGQNSLLNANVTLYQGVRIGKACIIHSGVVIGGDGFGFAQSDQGWFKVPQLGGVKIGDRVEIGANTTIDRGAINDTVINDGVKLDNQIQIGHNVIIGAHTIIAGCTGIAGSATIGKACMIGGGVGINGHIKIADRAVITGMTGISKSLTEPGIYSSGVQAAKRNEWKKNANQFNHLYEISKRVKELERMVAEINDNDNHNHNEKEKM